MTKKLKQNKLELLQSISLQCEEIVNKKEKIDILALWQKQFCTSWLRKPKNQRQKFSCDFDRMDRLYCSYEAVQAYDAKRKYPIDFYVREQIYRDNNEIIKCYGLPPGHDTLREFFNGKDIYIIPERMKWTFVITHETDWVGDPFYCEV